MEENFSLAGIFLVALLFLGGWFWHDHAEMNKKIEAAKNEAVSAEATLKNATLQQANLQSCLDEADLNYNTVFQSDCQAEGNAECLTNPTVYISVANHLD